MKTRIALLALLLAPGLGYGQSFVQSFADSFNPQSPFDLSTYKPQTGEERWREWVKDDGAGPKIFVMSLGAAAYKQAINTPSEWGRTPRGYLRRTGSSLASNVVQNSIQESMAAVAGTDTRYFACACTGFFPRTGHALKMTLFTYTHSGHLTLDIPQLSGAYGGSMIQDMWYPHSHNPLVQGVQGGHIEIGLIGGIHLVEEFSPEWKRLLHLH